MCLSIRNMVTLNSKYLSKLLGTFLHILKEIMKQTIETQKAHENIDVKLLNEQELGVRIPSVSSKAASAKCFRKAGAKRFKVLRH